MKKFIISIKNPFLRKEILKFFVRQYNRHPSSTFNRIWKWLDDVEKSGFDYAYARRLIAFSNDLKNKFYSEEMKEKVQNSDCLALVRDIWSSAGDICLLEKMLATDFNLYLPDVLMVKMDIACMANSLEARSPFLDNEFVELMASFPADLKVRRMTSKYILKRKLKGFLPEEIISRKKWVLVFLLGDGSEKS